MIGIILKVDNTPVVIEFDEVGNITYINELQDKDLVLEYQKLNDDEFSLINIEVSRKDMFLFNELCMLRVSDQLKEYEISLTQMVKTNRIQDFFYEFWNMFMELMETYSNETSYRIN